MLRPRNTENPGLEVSNGSANGPSIVSRRGKSLQYAAYTIGVVAIFVFFWVLQSEKIMTNMTEEHHRDGKSGQWQFSSGKQANMVCSCVCSQRRRKRRQQTDLLNNTVLLQQATEAKDRLLNKLKTDYGEYFEPIFVDNENGGYRPFKPSQEVSMERLKRKLKIKVLSMQMELGNLDSDFHGCDCSRGRDQSIRVHDVLQTLDTEEESVIFEGMENEPEFYGKYTWATGGHSASASHGNLYNESYTAYMESDMKDVFGSIGIEFEGRNYAMGGTSSATVISMCWKEIFGEDVDFFSWDYGMTDGRVPSKIFHYAYRGAISQGRPALMVLHNGGRSSMGRMPALQSLEKNGLPLFHMIPELEETMKDNFPDSQGISEEEIKALPEYVRNYKCGTGIEKGDPYCDAEKYSPWICPKRGKRASWHPGFKDHALDGHALSLFLVDALLDALRELKDHKDTNSTLLDELIAEDTALHEKLVRGPLPDVYKNVVDLDKIKEGLKGFDESSFNETLFINGPSMCHTARLPSQTRYNGILTNDHIIGKPVPVGQETYYVGHDINEAHNKPAEDNKMRIVYSMKERDMVCAGTNVTVKPDYPDSLYVNSLDGWAKLKFPNRAEKRFYRYNPDDYQGIIVFHIKKCDWGKCPANFLTIGDYNTHWEMKVNQQQIINVIDIGSEAGMAVAENGARIKPNESGQYEIEIKVNTAKKYLEFADFVIW